jgi:hypothetical protein
MFFSGIPFLVKAVLGVGVASYLGYHSMYTVQGGHRGQTDSTR